MQIFSDTFAIYILFFKCKDFIFQRMNRLKVRYSMEKVVGKTGPFQSHAELQKVSVTEQAGFV